MKVSRIRAQVFYQFYTIKVTNIKSRKQDLSPVWTWKLELQWSLEALSCPHQVCYWTRVALLALPQKLRHRMRESTHPASYFFCKKHSGCYQKQQAEGILISSALNTTSRIICWMLHSCQFTALLDAEVRNMRLLLTLEERSHDGYRSHHYTHWHMQSGWWVLCIWCLVWEYWKQLY